MRQLLSLRKDKYGQRRKLRLQGLVEFRWLVDERDLDDRYVGSAKAGKVRILAGKSLGLYSGRDNPG